MTAEYEMSREDLTAFNLHHHYHSPTARRQYLRAWFLSAAALLLLITGVWYFFGRERATSWRRPLDLRPLFGVVPIYLLYFPWAYRRKIRRIIASMVNEGHNRGLFGRYQVTLSPEAVTNVSELRRSSTAWRAVERIAANDDYAFISISALSAIIVPRRAFPAATGFEEFVRAARGYHEKAAA